MTNRPNSTRGGSPGTTERISGPGELLQAVPYLLGFHPRRSLVLVGLRDGLLMVTARLDLPDGEDDRHHLQGTVLTVLDNMHAGGTSEVIAAVYGDAPARDGYGRLRWTALADDLADLVESAGCLFREALLVVADRYWSLSCGSEDCCPYDGQPVPQTPTAFAARATVQGVVPLADRSSLAASLDPAPERDALLPKLARAEHDAVAAVLSGSAARQERSVKRALFAAARASDEARWQPPDDAELVRFGSALTSVPLRDAVWLAIDSRRIAGRPLWRELARRLPGPYDAAPLFLLGWASWRAGDGALATMAAERAIASDPTYSAADLLLAALTQGVDPRRFPKLSRTA